MKPGYLLRYEDSLNASSGDSWFDGMFVNPVFDENESLQITVQHGGALASCDLLSDLRLAA